MTSSRWCATLLLSNGTRLKWSRPSHVLSLWNRIGSFRLSDLDRLLWDERKLLQQWPTSPLWCCSRAQLFIPCPRVGPENVPRGNVRRNDDSFITDGRFDYRLPAPKIRLGLAPRRHPVGILHLDPAVKEIPNTVC